MKLKVKRFSDMGATRPSSGVFGETVEIDVTEGEYSTVELFGIFHAFRSFTVLEMDENSVTVSAVSRAGGRTTEHAPQRLRRGGIIGFSDSESMTSDDGPSWTATDDLYFEFAE